MERPIQILFRTKGVLVEKWAISSSKIVKKTRQFASTDSFNCREHDDFNNANFTEEGIFCKDCGVKLKLVPAWVVSS